MSTRADAHDRARAPARDVPRSAVERVASCVPVLVGIAAFALGYHTLYVGQPHEDAFILFEYARHLAAGDGIVFWSGGPHAEGATDFLWMLLLAATQRIGVDVAVAACLWNAAGAWLASALFLRVARRCGARGALALALALASGVVLGSGAAVAGWAGFSTLAYAALALLAAECALDDDPRVVRRTPLVALALALFRPDGVGVALAFALTGAFVARRARALAGYARVALAAALVGAAYFAWRWWYFGALLPLPLYVKSAGIPPLTLANLFTQPLATLPGLGTHAHWLLSRFGPLPYLVAIVALAPCAWAWSRRELVRALASIGGALVFLLVLAPGRHTQDFAYRFQAPAALLFAFAAWQLGCALVCDERRAPWLRSAALLLSLAAWLHALDRARAQLAWNASGSSYVDVLPARLDALLGGHARVALTEAGRVPFWTHAETFDAVGLNDPRTARAPLTQAYLREIDPDVVFFHVSDALRFELTEFPGLPSVVALPREALATHVHPWSREMWGNEYQRLPIGASPEVYASLALARYLAEHDGYELRLVRYQGAYTHVWAVKRALPRVQEILAELAATQDPSTWCSYATLARLPVRP